MPFRFACHRCGHCCSGHSGYVWLAEGETAALAASLGMSEASFVSSCVRAVIDPASGERALALREESDGGDAGGRCILLEPPNTCRAYTARPAHCRTFPYWPSVLADVRAFEAARATCPGIAVEPALDAREHAFRRLEALYREVDESIGATSEPRTDCCLESASGGDLFATALEADYALAVRAIDPGSTPSVDCVLGRARPLGCRLARCAPTRRPDGEAPQSHANELDRERANASFHERLRSIESATGYPSAYGRMHDLLRARDTRNVERGGTR